MDMDKLIRRLSLSEIIRLFFFQEVPLECTSGYGEKKMASETLGDEDNEIFVFDYTKRKEKQLCNFSYQIYASQQHIFAHGIKFFKGEPRLYHFLEDLIPYVSDEFAFYILNDLRDECALVFNNKTIIYSTLDVENENNSLCYFLYRDFCECPDAFLNARNSITSIMSLVNCYSMSRSQIVKCRTEAKEYVFFS